MREILKNIIRNRKHRTIAVLCLCILCISAVSLSIWLFTGNDGIGLEKAQVPLRSSPDQILAGDTVTVNVFADEMNRVYGYQFDINYDRECLKYKNRLYSDIDEIITIFATDKEEYLLVGATMIGDSNGYNGYAVPVCRIEFTALSDYDPGQIKLSRVNVVTDDLRYLENVDGWTVDFTVAR